MARTRGGRGVADMASYRRQRSTEFVGLMGALLGWLFRSTTERYLAQEVASLTVEGAAP